MGISLDEIKQAFASLPNERTPTVKDWEKLSNQWQSALNTRIQYLERLRDSMSSCIGCGCLSMTNCPIYNESDHLAALGSGPIILDKKNV